MHAAVCLHAVCGLRARFFFAIWLVGVWLRLHCRSRLSFESLSQDCACGRAMNAQTTIEARVRAINAGADSWAAQRRRPEGQARQEAAPYSQNDSLCENGPIA
jgi:hypothetical protein